MNDSENERRNLKEKLIPQNVYNIGDSQPDPGRGKVRFDQVDDNEKKNGEEPGLKRFKTLQDIQGQQIDDFLQSQQEYFKEQEKEFEKPKTSRLKVVVELNRDTWKYN